MEAKLLGLGDRIDVGFTGKDRARTLPGSQPEQMPNRAVCGGGEDRGTGTVGHSFIQQMLIEHSLHAKYINSEMLMRI